MKPEKSTNNTMKIVNLMIIGMVVAGAVIFVAINQASSGRDYMTTLFLAFLGAIITVQVIPCMVLLGSILKGIISLARKQVSTDSDPESK